MTDYTWPNVYFAYLFFAICLFAAIYFFLRSWQDGYWGQDSEAAKYRMLNDNCGAGTPACRVDTPVDARFCDAGTPACRRS
jgi:hypothetical protein